MPLVDREARQAYDQRYRTSPKGKVAEHRAKTSPNGKARKRRYETSPLGVAAKRRWEASPKGVASHRRYNFSEIGLLNKTRACARYRLTQRPKINYYQQERRANAKVQD